jgi:hypothetical protein
MLSPRLFAIDASPRGEGEKTINPVLKGIDHDSNAWPASGVTPAYLDERKSIWKQQLKVKYQLVLANLH